MLEPKFLFTKNFNLKVFILVYLKRFLNCFFLFKISPLSLEFNLLNKIKFRKFKFKNKELLSFFLINLNKIDKMNNQNLITNNEYRQNDQNLIN